MPRRGTILEAMFAANYDRENWSIATGSVAASLLNKAVPLRDEVNEWIDDENSRPSDADAV